MYDPGENVNNFSELVEAEVASNVVDEVGEGGEAEGANAEGVVGEAGGACERSEPRRVGES